MRLTQCRPRQSMPCWSCGIYVEPAARATGGPDRARKWSRVTAKLILSLCGGEPGANLIAELLHRAGEGITALPGLEQLARDAERGKYGRLVGLDHVTAGHDLPDHLVDVFRDRPGLLRAGIAAD